MTTLVSEVYPYFLVNYQNPEYLASRAIVCPNNQTVDEINEFIVSLLHGDYVDYLSCDTISKSSEHIPDFDVLYPTEFLNSIDANNFPRHKTVLKKGVTVMLLRNLNQNMGLCNGTRLLVLELGQRLLECMILTGSKIGEKVFIPRIALNTTDVMWPFMLCDDNK
jgi:ATP-dependent DNA helicase PIF1